MFRRIHVLLLTPALLFAQGAPDRPVPESVLFQFFFLRYSASDAAARAKGKSDSPAKRALKDSAGLTDTEISLVKEIAASCTDLYNAKSRTGGAEVLQLRAQNASATPTPAIAARIDTLERERTKIITDCQDSLRRGMGAARYARFEAYVRQTEGPKVRYVDPSQFNSTVTPPQRPASANDLKGGLQ